MEDHPGRDSRDCSAEWLEKTPYHKTPLEDQIAMEELV
jgi:hypothetical protein